MNRTVLITGASRGIGLACARAFAKEGDNLILNCIHSGELLQSQAQQYEEDYHISCRTFIGDIGDYEFVSSMFSTLHNLDILINNAGISYVGLLSDMSPSDWHCVINHNLNSCFYTSKHAIPLMLQRHAGRIINVSSMWGNVGASMEVAYSASKGGVNAFTKALAKELAPSCIQVNAIACGVIDTDMNSCFSAGELEQLRSDIPADRLGTPEEVAAAIVQLSSAPAYLTGQIITMDGGYT